MRRFTCAILLLLLLPLWSCSEDETVPAEGTEVPAEGEDLNLGELGPADMKADGAWGSATTCKPVPDLPRLTNPRIYVSLHGLTLRLSDPGSNFEKVFPIGPGVIDEDDSSLTYGESLSYFPVLQYGKQDFEIRPATIQPCKIWWTDPATRQRLPVFAGLPFLSWSGNYAIHGPVDNYRAASGGNLRRGFVSHGCLRMEAADVLELYARIKGVARVPVRIQREPERTADGTRLEVPVAQRWFGAECQQDADCTMAGGFCHANPYGGRGFCTARCERTCPDRAGQPVSFCVPDPDGANQGICVLKEAAVNRGCRPGDHQVPRVQGRFREPGVQATVCVPGSPGWVGDRCLADADCRNGTSCEGLVNGEPGMCTVACARYCPDEPGWPWTFCASEPELGGATCLRQCTPASNASECPAGTTCTSRPRVNDPATSRNVCVPL